MHNLQKKKGVIVAQEAINWFQGIASRRRL